MDAKADGVRRVRPRHARPSVHQRSTPVEIQPRSQHAHSLPPFQTLLAAPAHGLVMLWPRICSDCRTGLSKARALIQQARSLPQLTAHAGPGRACPVGLGVAFAAQRSRASDRDLRALLWRRRARRRASALAAVDRAGGYSGESGAHKWLRRKPRPKPVVRLQLRLHRGRWLLPLRTPRRRRPFGSAHAAAAPRHAQLRLIRAPLPHGETRMRKVRARRPRTLAQSRMGISRSRLRRSRAASHTRATRAARASGTPLSWLTKSGRSRLPVR
jgi:hypothetical protein